MNWNRTLCLTLVFAAMAESRSEIIKEDASSLTYQQSDHQKAVLKKNPSRVVIAYTSLAKVWSLAGGRAVGVPGVPEKKALPEDMRNLPTVGTAIIPNAEKIMMLEPDLVLLTAKLPRHRATARLLRKSDIPALCVDYNNYGDFHKLLDLFCKLNGRKLKDVPDARKVTEEVSNICAEARKNKPVRCAILFVSATGFSLESPKTNTGMIAEMLGAVNISRDQKKPRMPLSYEQLILDDPDVIFLVLMGNGKELQRKFHRDFSEKESWKTLKAAKAGRVHFLPTDLFLYMPGPDYPKAFRHLSDLLYPEKGNGAK